MSIIYRSNKRFQDPNESITYEALDALANGTAEVEPDTVRLEDMVLDDLIQILSGPTINTALFTGNLIHIGATAVGTNVKVLLADSGAAPDDATVDSVVTIDQRMTHIYFTGYIDPGTDFPVVPLVKIFAHNIGNAEETVLDGQVINYAVHTGTIGEQPLGPNAQLRVTPGHRWLTTEGEPTFEPVTIEALNATATPTIDIPDGVITELELNSDDIAQAGALYTGRRNTFTVPTNVSVPIGPAILLGTVVFNPALSVKVVKVGADRGSPLFTGYVTSSNGVSTVSLYARNNTSTNTLKIRAFTVLNIIGY